MPKPSPTQPSPSTPLLSEAAKFLHVPPTAVETGWPPVRAKLADLGIRLRWWQVPIARIILSLNASGKYTTTIGGVGLSIPRQVGKTFLVGALVFALAMLRPGLTVIWSAHRTRTAEETFKKMQGFARRKAIKPHVLKVVLGSGEESIEFFNGSRIMFGARAAGFGRGFDEVDVVVYDEAQILDQSALDDMVPAMNQCRQPEGALMFFMGTPPQEKDILAGKAEVFTAMRESAEAKDEDTAWVEFGADDDYEPTLLPAPLAERDWKQIRKANPSFPEDTPRESILRMRKKLGDASFLLEGAGNWPKPNVTTAAIPAAAWSKLAIPDESIPLDPVARFALTMTPNRVASIAVAVPGEDAAFLDLAELERVDDSRKLVDWLVERCGRRIPLMIDSRDPAASFINELRSRGVKVNATTQQDAGRACGGLLDAVEEKRIQHISQPAITAGLKVARKKPIGKAGLWEWDLDDPTPEVAAVRALTLAHYGLSFIKKRTNARGGKVVVLQ